MDFEAVIAGCRQHNRKAQKQLYEAFSRMLLGICMRYASSTAEAEDILQEVFLKIFTNINDYEGKGSFVNWMKKVTVNTAITHYHRNLRHTDTAPLDELRTEASDDISADSMLSADDLMNLLNRMPAGYRVVFNLFALEGLKHREIADQLGIDENTSKSQFLRARAWLKKEIEKLEP